MTTAKRFTTLPHIPAAARKAGATSIRRCSAHVFAVGYTTRGVMCAKFATRCDLSAPGHGPAVVAALTPWAEARGATVEWSGQQQNAIFLVFEETT